MTRIESTSSPRSHTARTYRSTSTDVLPVPAPADTKTVPSASTAASCSSFNPSRVSMTVTTPPRLRRRVRVGGGAGLRPAGAQARLDRRHPPKEGARGGTMGFPTPSWARNPADRPEVAPLRAAVALRVVSHVSGTDALRVRPRALARRLDVRPKRLLVEVVVAREARKVFARRLAQHAPRVAPAGERAIEAPERLDADEVA